MSIWSVVATPAIAQQVETPVRTAAAANSTLDGVASGVWSDAAGGRFDAALDRLRALPAGDADAARLRSLPLTFDEAVARREEQRKAKLDENRTKLDAELAKGDDPEAMSEAIKYAVGVQAISNDKAGVLNDPRIKALIPKAEAAAKAAEAKGDWFLANELFYRLNILLEDTQPYREDVKRLNQRLLMLRLFVPERFWTLRNDERLKEGKSPLPPYNDLGENWKDRLVGITPYIVAKSINQAAKDHVDPEMRKRGGLLAAGLQAVRTMVTTTDLEPVFSGLGQKAARDEMVAYIDRQSGRLRDEGERVTDADTQAVIDDLMRINERTVKLPPEAILRELGDGAMDHLDEFSGIIWPDEVARFSRMTGGNFTGVGIQIQMDEESQLVKVVVPLEGTPAQKAGVRAGDLLKKVNGKSAVGVTLNQAVDLITGPPGTEVTITVERPLESPAPDGPKVEEKSFTLKRTDIPLAATKGWRKTGPKDSDWDYFIDPADRIGYVRIVNFTPKTSAELIAAIKKMQATPGGLGGLIIDLRGNPGGLLDQAVEVAGVFVDHGPIVNSGRKVEHAPSDIFKLRNVPLVVLVNEGSASASEIVSGALKHYAQRGDIQAVLIGQRTYGKGSVQNVWDLRPANAAVKVTTAYYKLPDGKIIHRKPGAQGWGVAPNIEIEMLPEQITKMFELRQDADVWGLGADGQRLPGLLKDPPSPDALLTEGLDLQLKAGLVLLQSQTAAGTRAAAAEPR